MKTQFVTPRYVDQLPEQLTEGVLYICEEFSTTAHKCCCGCGEDVYNKLSPARWRLIKRADGRVSLEPSVGNWKYACRSHYFIRDNRVIEAGPMSASAIATVQERDRRDRDTYIADLNAESQVSGWRTIWRRVRAFIAWLIERLGTRRR